MKSMVSIVTTKVYNAESAVKEHLNQNYFGPHGPGQILNGEEVGLPSGVAGKGPRNILGNGDLNFFCSKIFFLLSI